MVDGGESAAGGASSKVGSGGNLSPAVLELLTLLVLPFLCFFFTLNSVQRRLSSTKS